MNIDELVQELDRMVEKAPVGEKTATVILFGIRFYRELDGVSAPEIARRASLVRDSFGVEIAYGRTLGKYVVPKG